jgi:hypothetical protein
MLEHAPSDGLGRVSLPGAPLAAAFERALIRLRNPYAAGESAVDQLFEQCGLQPRQIYAWRVGERRPTLDPADRALIALDLLWWDVWNEDTVRRPVIEVRSYKFRDKRGHDGGRKPTRCIAARTPYGDLGPDWDELARIERLMTGQQLEAAA